MNCSSLSKEGIRYMHNVFSIHPVQNKNHIFSLNVLFIKKTENKICIIIDAMVCLKGRFSQKHKK